MFLYYKFKKTLNYNITYNEMDCPICLELIENSAVGSCQHHFCYKCLTKWVIKGGKNCPTCKEYIYKIQFDREFDSINNNTDIPIILDFAKEICINNWQTPPGITISNNKNGGIKILKINKNDQFYKSGIKVNDVIISMNGMPCFEHVTAIKIIQNSYQNKIKLIINVLL
jgi:hypothetical protein